MTEERTRSRVAERTASRPVARVIAAAIAAAGAAAILTPGGPPWAALFLVLAVPLAMLALGAPARVSVDRPRRARGERSFPGPLGLWEWGGFALCAAFTAQFVWIAAGTRWNFSPDAAYYFGVARHMVETGAYEEPIVWHFLAPPASVLHPPFDYWSGLTSLALVPCLAVFGPSQAAAAMSVAAISGLGLFVYWWLVAVAAPIRSRAVQLLCLVAFAWSPAIAYYRLDAESVPFAILALLLALAALASRRLLAAVAFAFLVVLCRGDGAIACAAVWVAAGAIARRAGPRQLRNVSALVALLLASYATYHAVLFGTPTPPAARIAPYLDGLPQLLRYGEAPTPSLGATVALLSPARVAEAVRVVAVTFLEGRLVPLAPLWLALAAVASVRVVRSREPALLVAGGLCTLGALAIALGSLSVHVADLAAGAPSRGLMILIPLLLLLGGVGIDEILRGVERLPVGRPAGRILGGILVGALAVACVADLGPYGWRRYDRDQGHYAELARRTRGETVLTDRPYWVVANTRSPAVALPSNGEDAIEAVIDRYEPAWLLIPERPAPEMLFRGTPGEELVAAIFRGERVTLGRYGFEPEVELAGLRLFRIRASSPRPPTHSP